TPSRSSSRRCLGPLPRRQGEGAEASSFLRCVDTGAAESIAFPRPALGSRHPKKESPMPDRTPQPSHHPRRIVVFAVLSLALLATPIPAQTPGPQETLRIAQIEQVTNFDPALMSTQDMGVLIDN